MPQEQLSSGGTTTEVKDYGYDPNGNRLSFTDTPAGNPQNATTYSYGYNVHDSTSELIDPQGNVKASYGYTPYGQPDTALTQGDTSQTNPLNPFRYEAKRFDSGSQSYNTGARQYSPGSAHFLTADVYHGALANLGLSSDLLTQDRYALAGGNPLSYIEWDGHMITPDGSGGSTTPDLGAAYFLAYASPSQYQAAVDAGLTTTSALSASVPSNSDTGSTTPATPRNVRGSASARRKPIPGTPIAEAKWLGVSGDSIRWYANVLTQSTFATGVWVVSIFHDGPPMARRSGTYTPEWELTRGREGSAVVQWNGSSTPPWTEELMLLPTKSR